MYDDGSVDRTWMGPSEVEFFVTPYHPSSEETLERDGIVLQDRIITTNDLDVSLRFYMPATIDKKTTEKLPVILHFQGATTCQAVVISVSTRLAQEHRLPSAIDDGYTTLLWLRSLARSDENDVVGDKLDFSRVFLIGDSSGGNLVHEVAARVGRDEENDCMFWSPLKLAGVIPVHPGFVRSYRSRSEMEGKEGPFLTLDMLDKLLALALPVGSIKDHPFACPMGDAAPQLESLRLPPMMVCIVKNDLTRDTYPNRVCRGHEGGGDGRAAFC
ncbi:alpha/beta-Hydrolases superfamily protein [Zostera marina]|uniref:Alpha/beta-Hydrolases superfamily protein n=1 Tax=Zostera marina TaxID=29655 RepID=A0A0K9P6L3_ZOSMR|nr:alpha/beta-Hydrolases superfamily protein [Zostera marina]